MNQEDTKAKRDHERIKRAMHAVADAKQQFESLAIDDVLSNMVHEQLMIAFTYISNAYGLARKMVEQEGMKKMTREEFWEIVKKLVPKDYWDAQSVPSKGVKDILTNSLLIPAPKFKVGDRMKWTSWSNAPEDVIEERLYNPDANIWSYLRGDMETFVDENELELVEEKK